MLPVTLVQICRELDLLADAKAFDSFQTQAHSFSHLFNSQICLSYTPIEHRLASTNSKVNG